MWPVSDAAQRWYDRMADQTEHEGICPPCLLNGVPMCAEGLRLQQAARAAHEDWVNEQYGGKAVA